MAFKKVNQNYFKKRILLQSLILAVYTVWSVNDVLINPCPFIILVDPHPFKAAFNFVCRDNLILTSTDPNLLFFKRVDQKHTFIKYSG